MSANLWPVIIPMFVFTLVVFVLACVVLWARRLLTPEMDVPVTINGQRTFTATTGDKLLWQLASQDIYLPAACGGRGACGQCRVEVLRGGGGILPTEISHLTREEANHGMRLACSVTVREPMAIRLPRSILEARRWTATVRSSRYLATFLKELILELEDPIDFEAGEYVLLEAPRGKIAFSSFVVEQPYRDEWQRLGYFALEVDIVEPTLRAYSLANPPAAANIAMLVVRIATPPTHAPPETPPGMVSSYVFSLRAGDRVELSGPFGEFGVRASTREMIFIGGGAGVAPLRSMIVDQVDARQSKRAISFWYGARNLRELCYRDEFEALAREHENFRYEVALSEPEPDDQWQGPTGFIHNIVFETYLHDHPRPEEAEYYLCGPPLMSAAVLAMLEDLGVGREAIFLDNFGDGSR